MTVLRSNTSGRTSEPLLPAQVTEALKRRGWQLTGLALIALATISGAAILSYAPGDPSFNSATDNAPINLAGHWGAVFSDLVLQVVGYAALIAPAALAVWAAMILTHGTLARPLGRLGWLVLAIILGAVALAGIETPAGWPLASGLGGVAGSLAHNELVMWAGRLGIRPAADITFWTIGVLAVAAAVISLGLGPRDWLNAARGAWAAVRKSYIMSRSAYGAARDLGERAHDFGTRVRDMMPAPTPHHDDADIAEDADYEEIEPDEPTGGVLDAAFTRTGKAPEVTPRPKRAKTGRKAEARRQQSLPLGGNEDYAQPPLEILDLPGSTPEETRESREALQQNARYLSTVLEEYGVKGEIVKVRPGPVVTLYELEPAPGTKTSRVIGLSDDIARSMSAVSVRVAVVPGRNVIGIEMPNANREMVHLRELLASSDFEKTKAELPLALGKDIGGGPVTVDLARMPHLLIAGTTGSGKSVAMNTMILSLLYNLPPDRCKFIMIDPKMLELSVYQEIPHLLTPVVTDPSKAVVALKWVVREMEDRYRAMSQMGVRNIGGYNQRLAEAKKKGETLTRTVQTGFDEDGKPVYEEQPLPMEPLPYIVVVVDEMADLMLVAGKDVEAAIQRLAQMARAAGIHLMMATQRPSVDVITGTIKANFPSRISFQVTSKIDSRTILGEQGAEQLLGQGDMLYMAGGGRISRVHGPFVSDEEVERVVQHLKTQAAPEYIEAVTEDSGEPMLGEAPGGGNSEYDEHYDQAVALVAREGKASTSFIQRHFQIGYNRAARIIETMEREGVVSAANRVGRREVLIGDHSS
ncbi:MAG: DNA translocase FtsK [Rhodospirillales bacterium]|nr:DNA translocase FtsK [Rhodospirillales bacterium]MBO6787653.1 DNA translocase FtsK [Rhodospirillales bacterium]